MDKKVLSGAIASAVALAGVHADAQAEPGKNTRGGLDNPLPSDECTFDADGFSAHWTDPNENPTEDTKYGGDLELDAACAWVCEAKEESFDGFAETTLSFDLSQDAEDPFSYGCEVIDEGPAVACWADLSWDAVEEAVDQFGNAIGNEVAEECFYEEFSEEANDGEGGFINVAGTVHVLCDVFPEDGGSVFSVKEMKPGHGGGKQNWEKSYQACEGALAPD